MYRGENFSLLRVLFAELLALPDAPQAGKMWAKRLT
jgi:hypothetical protein